MYAIGGDEMPAAGYSGKRPHVHMVMNGGISRDELEFQALEWARWHNGLSGRTARQFVDQLAAKLNFKSNPFKDN